MNTKIAGYVLIIVMIMTTTVYAASSSASVTISSSNRGTAVGSATSESTGNGVSVAESNADAKDGSLVVSESSSTAKDNEVVISKSNAVSTVPNQIIQTNTVNGKTTSSSLISSSSSISPSSSNGFYSRKITNANSNPNEFFSQVTEQLKVLSILGIENVAVTSVNKSPNVTTNNEPSIQIINFSNSSEIIHSDVLVMPNQTVDIPDLDESSPNETVSVSNGSNMTYSITTGNSPPSLIKIVRDLLHI